ncbi:MAG: GGDEF domain-containing protein, partial [Candidatus Saccharimonadales bacterium]
MGDSIPVARLNQIKAKPMDLRLRPVDPAQALRLRRCWLGMVSYLMFALPLGYMNHYGWLRYGTVGLVWLVVAALLVNGLFLAIIRSGINLRFADPSLTLLQIGAASVMTVYVLGITNEGRGVLLLLYFTSFFFGVFRLNRMDFLRLSLFAVLLYTAFFIYVLNAHPSADTIHLEILHFMVLVIVLTWLSLLGGYVANLRHELRNRNQQLELAMERVRELLVHDELTKAYNRRYLMEIMRREQSRADRRKPDSSTGFSVCIMDIDDFKSINDRYGHLVGDQVLVELADRVRRQIRNMDWLARTDQEGTFARFGGEEFVLVMPDTDSTGAIICAERLREAICNT